MIHNYIITVGDLLFRPEKHRENTERKEKRKGGKARSKGERKGKAKPKKDVGRRGQGEER